MLHKLLFYCFQSVVIYIALLTETIDNIDLCGERHDSRLLQMLKESTLNYPYIVVGGLYMWRVDWWSWKKIIRKWGWWRGVKQRCVERSRATMQWTGGVDTILLKSGSIYKQKLFIVEAIPSCLLMHVLNRWQTMSLFDVVGGLSRSVLSW